MPNEKSLGPGAVGPIVCKGLAMNAMRSRQDLMVDFLAAAGWARAEQRPLPGDASTRRYIRLHLGAHTAMLMDQPQNVETATAPPTATPDERRALGYNAIARLAGADCARFVAAADYLRHCGLKSPDIYAADVAHGFLLIEDLGTDLYTDIIERDGGEHALYETAIDALVTLHELPAPASLSPEKPLFVYDEAAMLAEIDLLTEWFFPLAVGRHPGECETQEHRALWKRVLGMPMDRRYSSIATITPRIYCGADRSPVSTGSASSIFRTLWPDRRPMTSFRCWRMPDAMSRRN